MILLIRLREGYNEPIEDHMMVNVTGLIRPEHGECRLQSLDHVFTRGLGEKESKFPRMILRCRPCALYSSCFEYFALPTYGPLGPPSDG